MNEKIKRKVAKFLDRGFLLSPEVSEQIDDSFEPDEKTAIISALTVQGPGARGDAKPVEGPGGAENKVREPAATPPQSSASDKLFPVELLSPFDLDASKKNVKDFTAYFRIKYENLRNILRRHSSLSNLTSISYLRNSSNEADVSVIGMIADKQQTKNSLMFLVEDLTGTQRIFIGKDSDIYDDAQNLVVDEVVGLKGRARTKGRLVSFFPKEIVFPDIPLLEQKKSPAEEYMACMSDLHFGSKQFMPKEFEKFLKWVNGGLGSPSQREMAEKLKYIIVAGDIVDGIGIYHNQQEELSTLDIKRQYEECAEALSRIPEHIQIVVSPGNHDAVRMAEPQPPLNNEFSNSLTRLKNVHLVPNPATVRIGAKEGFSGFVCLVYHGYSFDYYVANVDSIRQNGGYERADLIMKFLMKRRHLAPAHESTLIHPTSKRDALFIDQVPDFFITGHVHRTNISSYKSVSLINSSCWQSMTSFQERFGHKPQPAILPLVNLKTRKIHKIDFN